MEAEKPQTKGEAMLPKQIEDVLADNPLLQLIFKFDRVDRCYILFLTDTRSGREVTGIVEKHRLVGSREYAQAVLVEEFQGLLQRLRDDESEDRQAEAIAEPERGTPDPIAGAMQTLESKWITPRLQAILTAHPEISLLAEFQTPKIARLKAEITGASAASTLQSRQYLTAVEVEEMALHLIRAVGFGAFVDMSPVQT